MYRPDYVRPENAFAKRQVTDPADNLAAEPVGAFVVLSARSAHLLFRRPVLPKIFEDKDFGSVLTRKIDDLAGNLPRGIVVEMADFAAVDKLGGDQLIVAKRPHHRQAIDSQIHGDDRQTGIFVELFDFLRRLDSLLHGYIQGEPEVSGITFIPFRVDRQRQRDPDSGPYAGFLLGSPGAFPALIRCRVSVIRWPSACPPRNVFCMLFGRIAGKETFCHVPSYHSLTATNVCCTVACGNTSTLG